jgi:aryl-alcohol dehydrogenase-like predicted oxidoreductase
MCPTSPRPLTRTDGLCASCVHRRVVTSSRGSMFILCERSATDPTFPRYPALPVVACRGYRPVTSLTSGFDPSASPPSEGHTGSMSDMVSVRQLGSTGLIVSRLGLGLAALGRPAYINLGRAKDYSEDRTVATLERRCHDMLDAACAAGIRYIDAARSYGLAEEFLARWIQSRGIGRDPLVVGSKWGYTYVGAWDMHAETHEQKDLSVTTLRRQFGESRELLGDWLRLYQIHSATLESGVLENAAVLDELRHLRSMGVAVGLTVTGPSQADTIRRAMEVRGDGVMLFQVVQATWNLLEPSGAAALEEAHARGVGVIVKEAVANGRLTDRNTETRIAPVRNYAASQGVTTDVVALGAALACPWADIVLSGAVTRDQLASNLRAPAYAVAVDRLPDIAETATDYWAHRRTLAWT